MSLIVFLKRNETKVTLEGMVNAEVTLPSTESLRIREPDDSVPPFVPFPRTTRWGTNIVDPIARV
jgi:hypothetical protein